MSSLDRRLRNQRLTGSRLSNATDVVRWLGAVQSQDYVGAKWAVGLRARRVDNDAIDQAFNDGEVLRTHVLRPTWHFVARDDIRWMVELTGPRVQLFTRRTGRQVGLDERAFAKAGSVVERALGGGAALTRKELAATLRAARIDPTGLRLGLLMIDLEARGIICSGPLKNRQFTYALVTSRAPHARSLARDEALAELATRFFQSHGPATVKDFVWWSGLTTRDAKAAADLARVDVLATPLEPDRSRGATFLLSNYDEYLVAYKDRRAVIDPVRARQHGAFTSRNHPHHIIVDGCIAGNWRRAITRNAVIIYARLHGRSTRQERQALVDQAERYGKFLGLSAEVHFDS